MKQRHHAWVGEKSANAAISFKINYLIVKHACNPVPEAAVPDAGDEIVTAVHNCFARKPRHAWRSTKSGAVKPGFSRFIEMGPERLHDLVFAAFNRAPTAPGARR